MVTPRDRAEKIVERFLSTPEGFAPDDKQALIAAIEQGMQDATHDLRVQNINLKGLVKFLKSPDNSRNTITDNQKD